MTIEELVKKIRDWEMDAGESFCDYFLDNYSYSGSWLEFLTQKGFTELVEEIEADVYVCLDGTVLGCTDQQLKFEPYSSMMEKWDAALYLKDVALWAEFILADKDLLKECEEFLDGYFE